MSDTLWAGLISDQDAADRVPPGGASIPSPLAGMSYEGMAADGQFMPSAGSGGFLLSEIWAPIDKAVVKKHVVLGSDSGSWQ